MSVWAKSAISKTSDLRGELLSWLLVLGALYWIWMSVQLGSTVMHLAGLYPVTILLTAPLGAFSLLFGTPSWLVSLVS